MHHNANGLPRTPMLTSVSLASLSTFYGADIADRPFKAVIPCIWTSLAVNMSLITACVPSIRRLITDWAAGIMNAGVMEPYELQNSTNTARSGRSLNARIFRRSHPHAHVWPSSSRKESGYPKYANREVDDVRVGSDRNSEMRLTDGIYTDRRSPWKPVQE